MQLRRQQLVADIEGTGGYATLYGKHGGRTIRVGRRTWEALQFLAEGKEPDERIIAITDERIRQILTAAAAAAGFNRLGEVRDRSFEQQRYRASGLNVVVVAIVLWNTIHLQHAVQALTHGGQAVDEALLRHLSPLGWEHINLRRLRLATQ